MSPCNSYIITGGYNKSAHVIDLGLGYNNTVETKFDMKRGKPAAKPRKYGTNKKLAALEGAAAPDFKKKVL